MKLTFVPQLAGLVEDAAEANRRSDYERTDLPVTPQSEKWYRRAARQGNAKAQNSLGVMYREGHGVPQDQILAYMWFYLATSRLPVSEKEDREKAERNRDGIASIMIPSQLAEAELLARGWKPMEEN